MSIPPPVMRTIEEIAKNLPALQKQINGKPQFRVVSKFTGYEFNKNGDKYRSTFNQGTEPVLVNHKLNLVEEYKKHGLTGVNKYVAKIDELIIKHTQANPKQND